MQTYDSYWYKQSKPFQAVFAYIKKLENDQAYRAEENSRNMKLYGNYEYSGLAMYNYARTEQTYNLQNRVTLNVVQSMVDTVESKITKQKPRPYFLTDGGDFSLQRKAEKLTQFVEGQFYASKFYDKARKAFKAACIFGTGALKIYIQDNDIKVEFVFIDEIKIDDTEAYYGEPRQMHQTKWIHKDVLKAAFPGFAKDIEAVSQTPESADTYSAKNGYMVKTIESWHLRSGKKATDGKRVICIANATLVEEKYEKDYFPFVFFRWNDKPVGFFGQGIAEQLTGIQLEINKILKTIQVSMHLVSVPKIYVEAGSKIVSAHLNNKIGGIIKYAGKKPEEGTLGQIPPDLFNQLDRLYQRAYEIIGVSQLSAQAQKPAGLDSGKALRTYNDLESERFQSTQKMYEQGFLDAAAIMIDLAKEIAEATGNYEIKVAGSSFLKTINWKDVEMDEDKYMMQAFPTSALSQEPSARFQEVQELLSAGFVNKEDGMKLLDFPDLKAYYNMANAGVEDIERQIELMIDKNEYQTPEPYQNLQYGVVKMQQAYLMYRSQNAPEETLELFRRWIEDANSMMQQAQNSLQAQQNDAQMAQAQAQNVAAAPPPELPVNETAVGAAPAAPVSDMLPQV